ncbi:MAG TPA: histidine kinase [Caldimonas sp.]|nr:histidine kinase [Caldimonas sp.]
MRTSLVTPPLPVTTEPPLEPPKRAGVLSAFTLPRVAVALAMAVLVAIVLNPVFTTRFPVLLGRTLVIAMLLLLAYTVAGIWKPPMLPRWLAQVLAVAIVAPIATFLVYVPSIATGAIPLSHEGFAMGYTFIAGTALLIGPLLALGALYRERDAEARSEALRFALEKSTLEKQALDARVRLLHAQVEPHFLFNTLANVQALVESGSPRAGPVLKSLIAYLRAAMPKLSADATTLGTEADLGRAYLELMHMRMPDRLAWRIEIPEPLRRLAFPPMALLTLIENAIRHGIDPAEAGGAVTVRAWRDDGGRLHVEVADTGAGLAGDAPAGTGLANLRDRLRVFFDADARLELHAATPHGVRAEIVVHPRIDA